MAKAKPAYMDMDIHGYIEDGKEVYHEVVLWDNTTYIIELEADDEDADLDLYITDEEGTILYQDEDAESGAAVEFEPGEHAIHLIFVKSADGDTDYAITITEQEE